MISFIPLPISSVKFKSRSLERREQCMQEHLYKRHSGFGGDVSVIFADKTDGSNPIKKEIKRETDWMRTLKTIATYGLNVENSV